MAVSELSTSFLFCLWLLVFYKMNELRSQFNLDSIIQLSKDNDTLGFDLSTQTWIYPTNYERRDYQYNITQAALHNNTLVSLPTGLGKTFIAAVVMYNFYRWYPLGKIIFMAPTRPLVKQQQEACYNTTAIPPNATVEMTGNNLKANRVKIWKEKSVFFITPQILQNDIDVVLDLAQQIKCIVIDEAHKALGKHAYCEAIKKIYKINKYFRVLALSATPGSNFKSVRDVITNLLISHIEARTNESIDVAPYVFERKLETFIIPITGELLAMKNKYIMILDKYTRPLLQYNIFSGNCANLTKGRIVLTMKEFKEKGRQHPKYSYILKNLNVCVTLYHGYELLIRHGLRGFLGFFNGTISKPLMNSIQELHGILNDVRNYLGSLEEVEMLPDGTIPEVEGPIVYSHPKFQKLTEVLNEHFKALQDTKVMVFCEYRESVMEIYQLMLRQRPLIKPRVFVGQGAISQAKQLQAIKQFKSGDCNTLISTCIGEEGLDVGEVDLIVCFDISSKSPTRIVQRMGRTGRKRDGRVVFLVTEGKEQQLLTDCMLQKNNMISLLESQAIKQYLYTNNPKMIPDNIKVQCCETYITVKEPEKPKKKEDSKKKTKAVKNSNTIKNMFDNISSESCSNNSKQDPIVKASRSNRSPIKASRTTKRINTPSKNQLDLRSMFTRINSTQTLSQDCTVETSNKIEECPVLNNLISKIRSYLDMTIIDESSCKICDILNNTTICSTKSTEITTKWKKPNLSILDSITSESLSNFCESINTNSKFKTIHENERSYINHVNNLTAETSNVNTLLKCFNLESTFEVFSDFSTEVQEEEYCVEDPIIFNHSIGIFESSKIYHSPAKENIYATEEFNKTKNNEHKICENENVLKEMKTNKDLFEDGDDIIVVSDSEILPEFHKTKNNEQTVCENENMSKEMETNIDLFEDEDDLIVDSDTEISPVICSQRFTDYKQKFQRKLFSQSQENSASEYKNQQTTCEPETVSIKCNLIEKQDSSMQKISKLISNCETKSTKSIPPKPSYHIAVEKATIMKNTNMSTPNNTSDLKNEYNMVFWDESLFEDSDSDESLFEDENKENTNKNTSPKYTQNQTEDLDKELNKNTESKEDSDSDATVILSFCTDGIFEDIEKENLKFQSMEQSTKPITSTESNKSVYNKTINSSLLSVTQAIELLNDSKFKSLDSPAKPNESTNLITSNQSLLNQTLNSNLLKTSVTEENQRQLNNSLYGSTDIDTNFSNNETYINIDCTTNSTGSNKENQDKNKIVFDDLDISEIFKEFDDESEEEFSLLSFSQNRKRKLQRNHTNSEGSNGAKSARTSMEKEKPDNTQSKKDNIDKTSKIDSNKTELENKKTVNSNGNDTNLDDFEQNSLLVFAQNMNKMRKKIKLSTLKTNTKSNDTLNKTITQISPVQQPTKKGANTKIPVIDITDSDDDFEVRPTIKPVTKLITPVKKIDRINSLPSYKKSNDNAKTITSEPRKHRTRTKKINLRKKSAACAFIDDQAVVEDDEHYVSDSESDKDSDEQLLDSSFVSHTQNVLDQTDMRAKYLQSIRSPKFKPGAFKIPHRPPPQIYEDVFSQIENYENETYMDDSFCVGNDQTLSQREGMSYLEIIEAQLENDDGKRNKKRKRIITISDSD